MRIAALRTIDRRRAWGCALIALASLLVGFGATAQLRSQQVSPYNRVERNQALVRSVRDLERTNSAARDRITRLRGEIANLEAQAAQRSDETRSLEQDVGSLRAHAGLTRLRGPGVSVEVANGRPGTNDDGKAGYLVTFQDVQDVVNLLFAGGAEGVAVNGRRITPLSGYRGGAGTVEIDQGPPMISPFRLTAVGNRSQMQELLDDPSTLGDLRFRQRQFGVRFSWSGSPDVALPAFDGNLEASNARPL